ncbi:Oar protein [Acidisarcina polymorpha]|uniref:Oar protein n=2 Tax=Acidisarcina polymorpha TaxID=2211140 RepID=A0A2Z5G0D9_9BACT|nr:Oar protein [Acidisarcina polymorpha]
MLLAFSFTLSASAQLTTADILGTVSDASGAVIPGADVKLTNLGTNETHSAVTNDTGDYVFTLLPVGHYSISVKAKGFQESIAKDLSVEAGDRARADIHVQLGSESTVVEVTAQTPLLQADSATVSSTVTAKAVQDLPLNGRNFVQLVQLVPGANEGPGNGLSSGGRPDDRRTNAAGISVNGQDDTLNNWVVDGIDDNERIIGSIGVKPNVEGIQEITVQTNSYAAEAGRTAGGVINIVTRSGTNQFHGSVYEYFRNDIFDGRNYFQSTGRKPELRQNQYGASIGGPIFRDRTFFYFDFEGLRQVSGVTDTGTVPTMGEYDAINSIGGSTPQSLLSVANGTAGLPIDPIALNYLKLFPAPTNGNLTNNFTISPNKTQNGFTYDGRVDHRFNDKNLFFGRYAYNKVDTFTPPNFGIVNGLEISGGRYNFDGPATDVAQQYAFGYTHFFNQSLVLDLRAAYTRINNLSLPLNYGLNADQTIGFPAGMTSFSPFANSLTPISIGPFGDIGDGAYVPLQDIDGTFQYAGTVSWTKGNHNFKFGASLIRRQARNVQSASAVGAYSFNLPTDSNADQLTQQNNQLASTLVGAYNSETRNFNLSPPDYRSWEPSGFAQDSWKINPKLTLLYGLRYDVFTPFTEAHDHISNFDFPEALGLTAANIGDALKVAGVNGVDKQVNIPTDYSNVAPRLGFSYSLMPGTILRGGYGLSFFPGNYTSNADLKNAPFTSIFSPSCQSDLAVAIEEGQNGGAPLPGQNPACSTIGAPGVLNEGLPTPTAPNLTALNTVTGLSFVAEAPHFKSALIQQFNLQVEQQIGPNVFTIGYVGNIGQHLPESINNINQALPYNPLAPLGSAANPVGGARPLNAQLPNLGGVSYINSGGISNYSALQTSFQRRFTKGLAFDANYTWGKALSDITGFSQQGSNQGWSNANPLNIRGIEYGVAENDIQNRFAIGLNYEIQYGREFTGIKKTAFSGWQINLISAWQSGKPFTVINSGAGVDNPEGLGYSNRATPQNSGGNDRPDQLGDARLGNRSINHWFDTTKFAPQPLGTIGTAQRNSLFGPEYRHVDLSLFKTFPVTERVNLQFRVESFNIANTPNFYLQNGQPGDSFGNAGFGTISQTDPNYTPREFQFALKAQF